VGIDVTTAGMQLARALKDDSEELGRYKIQLEGARGSNERLGSMLDAVDEKVKGQAEQLRKAGGEVDELKKAFGEFAEDIGKKISPAIDRLAKGIRETLFPDSMNERRALERRLEVAKRHVNEVDRIYRDSNWNKKKWMAEAKFDVQVAQALLDEYDAMEKRKAANTPVGKQDFGLDTGGDDSAKKAAEDAKKAAEELAKQNKAFDDDQFLAEQKRQAEHNEKLLELAKEKNEEALRLDKELAEYQRLLDEALTNEKLANAERLKKADREKMESDFAYAQSLMSTSGNVMSAMASVAEAAGKDAEEMKALKISMALIDGASASVAMWRSVWSGAGNPYAAIAIGAINQAAIAATTAANVAIISQQKFADGGIVSGATGGDMTQVRANGGEMILTREHQMNLLAMANGRGGGGGGITINAGITMQGGGFTTQQDASKAIAMQQKQQKKTLRYMGNNGRLRRSGVATV